MALLDSTNIVTAVSFIRFAFQACKVALRHKAGRGGKPCLCDSTQQT